MKICIPKYINSKQNVIAVVVGTAIFAELFILIFKPFGSGNWVEYFDKDSWVNVADFIYMGFATLAVLVAMGIIAISRTMMYRVAKRHNITYVSFALWILGEVLSMALVYTLFSLFVLHVESDFFDTFQMALKYTSCILLIPYTIFTLYFSMKDKGRQLQDIQRAWKEKLATLGENNTPEEVNPILNFRDDKGELKLSIRTASLYYIVSADNYVDIKYLSSGKMQTFTLRSTLKRIEEDFENKNLVRCHRSYIVNFDNVKILQKADDGLILDFDHAEVPNIPVSKTYSARVLERFSAMAE